ncbi:MAG: HK97 family phage prohead protease [Amphiplicatus sp.]
MSDLAHIAGYASVFNVPDLNGDIVAPGAFKKALARRADIRMLYQHAVEAPIGRWTRMKEDARGLYVEGELILASAAARDIHALIAHGAIDGLSIGFQTIRSRKEGAGRVILEADLWEVSIVTFPMAEEARIARLGPPVPAGKTPPFAAPAGVSPPFADARLFEETLRGAADILNA